MTVRQSFFGLARRGVWRRPWAWCVAAAAGMAWGSLLAQPVGGQDQAQSMPGFAPHARAASAGVADPSPDAKQAYLAARDKLLQIRTLRRQSNTQSSTGSGFFVSADGLVVTNYHVMSQVALEPEQHRAVAVDVDGREVPVALLAFDVQHDLALLRVGAAADGQGAPPERAALALRPEDEPLVEGERIYSLGNPLDVGFAITEGTYNGLVQRSFYPRIFFGGALNSGMSGGPALDARGRVVGVNVAKRMGAEQVSFLVPVQYVRAMLQRRAAEGAAAAPLTGAAHAEVTRQLQLHQQGLVQRLLDSPPRHERYGPYRVQVFDDSLARCWGEGREHGHRAPPFDYERSQCSVDSGVFTGEGEVGSVSLRYEAFDGLRLSPWQFAALYSRSLANEGIRQRGGRHKTALECREGYVQAGGGLPVRSVVCMSAYRKFSGLYDLVVLVSSVDEPTRGMQGRLDVRGLSFDNAQRMAAHFINGFARQEQP